MRRYSTGSSPLTDKDWSYRRRPRRQLIKTSSTITKKRRSRAPVLLQLALVLLFLTAVWFSFGKNVLSPSNPAEMPQRIGDLELKSLAEGPEAMTQVNQLHGTSIPMVNAYIAEYVHLNPYHGNQEATVWVGIAADSNAGAALISRMQAGIARGNAGFENLQQFTMAGQDVFQVDGTGGQHFFYSNQEKVIWLTVKTGNALAILEETISVLQEGEK